MSGKFREQKKLPPPKRGMSPAGFPPSAKDPTWDDSENIKSRSVKPEGTKMTDLEGRMLSLEAAFRDLIEDLKRVEGPNPTTVMQLREAGYSAEEMWGK